MSTNSGFWFWYVRFFRIVVFYCISNRSRDLDVSCELEQKKLHFSDPWRQKSTNITIDPMNLYFKNFSYIIFYISVLNTTRLITLFSSHSTIIPSGERWKETTRLRAIKPDNSPIWLSGFLALVRVVWFLSSQPSCSFHLSPDYTL